MSLNRWRIDRNNNLNCLWYVGESFAIIQTNLKCVSQTLANCSRLFKLYSIAYIKRWRTVRNAVRYPKSCSLGDDLNVGIGGSFHEQLAKVYDKSAGSVWPLVYGLLAGKLHQRMEQFLVLDYWVSISAADCSTINRNISKWVSKNESGWRMQKHIQFIHISFALYGMSILLAIYML